MDGSRGDALLSQMEDDGDGGTMVSQRRMGAACFDFLWGVSSSSMVSRPWVCLWGGSRGIVVEVKRSMHFPAMKPKHSRISSSLLVHFPVTNFGTNSWHATSTATSSINGGLMLAGMYPNLAKHLD